VSKELSSAAGTDGRSGRSSRRTRATKGLLIVGFAALAVALVVAHGAPADGYEISLVAATPAAVWLALGGAVAVALLVSAYGSRTSVGWLGILLGGTSAATFAGMPLVRNYYHYGTGDPMVHLGATRRMLADIESYWQLIYPGSHTFASFLTRTAGLEVPRAMLLVSFLFVLVFLVFVPLTARAITGERRATYLAAVGAFMLMPINNVSTHPGFHPFTMTAMLLPLLLFFLFKHVTRERPSIRLRNLPTATGLGVVLAGLAMLFYHPQAMLNAIILLATVAVVQLGFRRYRADHPISAARPVVGQVVVLWPAFLLWSSGHWEFGRTATDTVTAVQRTLSGSAQVAKEVQSQGDSAEAIGVSITELFAKLFLVETVFVLLAAAIVVWTLLNWTVLNGRDGDATAGVAGGSDAAVSGGWRSGVDVTTSRDTAVIYFAAAGVALVPFSLLQFLGSVSYAFFRHLGFGMVVVTVLGAIAVAGLASAIGARRRRLLRPLAVVLAAAMIVLSAVAFFPSPFIYLSSSQSSEIMMDGYTTAYEDQHPNTSKVWFQGVRINPDRFEGALASKQGTSWYPEIVTPHPVSSGPTTPWALYEGLPGYFRTHPEPVVRRDHYMIITELDYKREVVAYEGLRYNRSAFASVRHQDNVSRIHDNGEFVRYYVDLDESRVNGTRVGARG